VDEVDRRKFLMRAAVTATALSGCRAGDKLAPNVAARSPEPLHVDKVEPVNDPVNVTTLRLTMPWQTQDPFLFCVHHLDAYPKGDPEMGPVASLAGRHMGQDFSGRDGWSMYHGRHVPGFPRHPHRGFETITVTRQGFIDHSDSLGATARYGDGDVQWMTAGKGIVHAEMFPLRRQDEDNTAELFQLWLNLPAKSKLSEPHFTMFWKEAVPVHQLTDEGGRRVTVTTIAGALHGVAPPAPPPESWASHTPADTLVWTIDLEPGARWTIPAAAQGLTRSLYFYQGDALDVAGTAVAPNHRAAVDAHVPLPVTAGKTRCQLLLLQGRPIGEPVAQHGPFVMNTDEEIRQAFQDYQRTGFGGWPWPSDDPVHPREEGRFALHPNGRRDTPA
jgi:redox-sensitive bicupin YhaK (pirin superfamily)